MSGNPLDRDSIARLVLETPPLISGYLSLEQQLQPNGFDLTIQDIGLFETSGTIGADTSPVDTETLNPIPRELSTISLLISDLKNEESNSVDLPPGPYLVTFSETVNLPLNVMALGRPRSSLLRSGVSLHTAVWDAGYKSR